MSFIKKLVSGADSVEQVRANALRIAEENRNKRVYADQQLSWKPDEPIASGPGPIKVETPVVEETADVKTLRIFSKHYDGLATRRNEIINEIRTLEKELGETELTMKATSAALSILNDAKVSEAAAAAVEAELTTETVIVHHHTGINSAA